MMNVLKQFPFSTRYYIFHPHIWIKQLMKNIRNAHMRATRGFCNDDVWCMCDWLLVVLPEMLRQLANQSEGYPYQYDPEDWKTRLFAIADVLESLQEGNWETRNEFGDALEKYLWKDLTEEQKQQHKEEWQLYLMRAQELGEERQTLLEGTLQELGKIFFNLGD